MQPQIDVLDQAFDLLRNAAAAIAVLRRMEAKCPRQDGLYAWIRAACLARFDAESEALAEQYRDVLDAPDEDTGA